MMIEPDYTPDFFHSFTFDNGIIVEFNDESTINFYNIGEELVMTLDPSDLTTLYAAYRAMIRENLEEDRWSDHTIKDSPLPESCVSGGLHIITTTSPGNLGGKQ